MLKICSQCKIEKQIEEFSHSRTSNAKDKRQSHCKLCQKLKYNNSNGKYLKPFYRFTTLLSSANTRNIKVDLSFEDYHNIIKNNCIYCDETTYGTAKGVGLDRIDSNKPYEITNIVSCCWECNRIKSDLSLLELKTKLNKIITGLNKLI